MNNYRILVVEDDEDIVETVKYSLELRGFTVDVAYDGLHALRKARQDMYDLMLLDIMLPGKNGYEVSRVLKEEMEQGKIKPFKILVLTARKVDNPEREDFLSTWSRADEYMYKPFEIDELLARVRNLVGLRRAEDELRRINADLEGEVERRALELARSEARYRTIVNAVPTSIMLLDGGGRIEAINAWHLETKRKNKKGNWEIRKTPNLAEYPRDNIDVMVGVNGTTESFLRKTVLERLSYREIWRLK